MKKLFFSVLLAISVAASAFATDTNNVNSTAVNDFEATFKKASDVKWIANNDYIKATFVLNNIRMEALYSPAGELIGTTKSIFPEELPVSAKRNFSKNYGGYTVKEAIRFEGNDEGAYFIAAENEKESVVLKVSDNNQVSLQKSTKK